LVVGCHQKSFVSIFLKTSVVSLQLCKSERRWTTCGQAGHSVLLGRIA